MKKKYKWFRLGATCEKCPLLDIDSLYKFVITHNKKGSLNTD